MHPCDEKGYQTVDQSFGSNDGVIFDSIPGTRWKKCEKEQKYFQIMVDSVSGFATVLPLILDL
jgi:hypothetical protein